MDDGMLTSEDGLEEKGTDTAGEEDFSGDEDNVVDEASEEEDEEY